MNELNEGFTKYAGALILFVLVLTGCGSEDGTNFETTQVTTFAGTGVNGSADGTGIVASFNAPYGIANDGTNLYVADTFNHKIRQIVIASGAVTTLAGTGAFGSLNGVGSLATFNLPYGIASNGPNLFVADTGNNLIRQIVIATGAVTTLAGSGVSGSVNGAGLAATFNAPYGIATDGTNLYVAEKGNHLIRQIVISSGVVTTLAGSGAIGSADGTGTAAEFNEPQGVASDGANLFVADTSNYNIRQIVISTGVVTTLAGTGSFGSRDGNGTAASFDRPTGIATDGTNLYIGDTSNHRVRKVVIATGEVTTLAGSGATGSSDGAGSDATFQGPTGITTDGANHFVADTSNHLIRKIN